MVAFAHGARGSDNGPDGQTAAKGNEGFFAQAAPYFIDGVFIVEVAAIVRLNDECANQIAYRFSSKEEGSGALLGPDMGGPDMMCGGCGGGGGGGGGGGVGYFWFTAAMAGLKVCA